MSSAAENQLRSDVYGLIENCLGSEIGPDDLARLQRLVVERPRARALYVEYMIDGHNLHTLAAARGAAEAAPKTAEELGIDCELLYHLAAGRNSELAATEAAVAVAGPAWWRRRPWEQAKRIAARPTPLSLIVAALVVGLLLTAMAFMAPPVYRSLTRSDDDAPSPIVAEVIFARDAQWSPASLVRGRPRVQLSSGQALELLQGTVGVRFASGAFVVLEGPAEFTPQGRNELQLRGGQLAARVPPPAVGFTVEALGVDVVDLGTEFSVQAAKEETQVQVLTGSVDVHQRSAAARPTRKLTAGEAVLFRHSSSQGFTVQEKKMNRAIFAGMVAALAAVGPDVAHAQTMTFTAPDRDTTIIAGPLASMNFGANNTLPVGRLGDVGEQRSLLSFDVSALSGQYTQIDSITLRLFVNNVDGTKTYTPQVYAITPANRNWVEGTSAAGAVENGSSSWDSKQQGVLPWAGSAGLSTPGTDYSTTLLAQRTFALTASTGIDAYPAAGSAVDFVFTGTTVQLTALIDAWLVDNADNGQPNPGLLLLDPNAASFSQVLNQYERISFQSRQAAANVHPQLIVNYSNITAEPEAVPEAAALSIWLSLGLGGMALVVWQRRRIGRCCRG